MCKDFAIIIGINDYTPQNKSGLRTLKGAINDANHFETWVKNPKGGNVSDENTFKIISEPAPLKPLQDEIDDAFLAMEETIKANGRKAKRLYFYFAGHGLGTLNNTNDTALCLANWSENRRRSALSSEDYKDTIKQYGYFEEIIFIADCCRNTKINVTAKKPTFAPIMPNANAGNTKLFVGYATQYQDQSYEIEVGDSEMRGVFTKVLINGLNGAAANENGIVNADSLRDYLILETPIEALKEGFKQKPDIMHSFTSDMALCTVENFQNKTVTCNITFNDARNSLVELINGNSDVIKTFDANQSKKLSVSLKKGLYILKDLQTNDMYPIQVSLSKNDIYVNF
jgi:uncharacterized caspase-like protein